MNEIRTLSNWIREGGSAVITTHQNPDADALGSSLGLALYLQKKGIKTKVISPTDYPAFLNWMEGNNDVIIYNPSRKDEIHKIIDNAELIFCLDFNSLDRINELGELVAASQGKKILIDHHLSPEDFYDFSYWSTEAAATAELIYELIVKLGDVEMVDRDIANCLYAGIMTDTGNFKHPNVTENVFRICGELVTRGADVGFVSRSIYDNSSINRLRLLGYSLNQKMRYLPEYRTAYISLSRKELYKFNAQSGDTEGLVNYALSVAGVKFAVLFTEKDDIVKMSFRSVGEFSVNDFARTHFNGGGHKNAAGGTSQDSLPDTLKKFESLLLNYKEQLQ